MTTKISHFLDSRNGCSSVTVSQVANFLFSSHNFVEVAVFKNFNISKIKDSQCMGRPCWCQPIQNSVIILEILKFFNYSYFVKIMTLESQFSGVNKEVPAKK